MNWEKRLPMDKKNPMWKKIFRSKYFRSARIKNVVKWVDHIDVNFLLKNRSHPYKATTLSRLLERVDPLLYVNGIDIYNHQITLPFLDKFMPILNPASVASSRCLTVAMVRKYIDILPWDHLLNNKRSPWGSFVKKNNKKLYWLKDIATSKEVIPADVLDMFICTNGEDGLLTQCIRSNIISPDGMVYGNISFDEKKVEDKKKLLKNIESDTIALSGYVDLYLKNF